LRSCAEAGGKRLAASADGAQAAAAQSIAAASAVGFPLCIMARDHRAGRAVAL
jgi:hypothetical protein